MFNSYVSTVLPELGEENMQQTTFQEYLEHWLGAEFRLEDPFAQIEYAMSPGAAPAYEARMSGMTYKASGDFCRHSGATRCGWDRRACCSAASASGTVS